MKNTNCNLSDYEQLSMDEKNTTNEEISGREMPIIVAAFGIALDTGLVCGFFIGVF